MKSSLVERTRGAAVVLCGWAPVPEDAPAWAHVALAVWWCALLLTALTFGGYGVKFVYIDF
jgi:hypothetical protein